MLLFALAECPECANCMSYSLLDQITLYRADVRCIAQSKVISPPSFSATSYKITLLITFLVQSKTRKRIFFLRLAIHLHLQEEPFRLVGHRDKAHVLEEKVRGGRFTFFVLRLRISTSGCARPFGRSFVRTTKYVVFEAGQYV